MRNYSSHEMIPRNEVWRRVYETCPSLFQILHIIDSVLEPLVPISLRDAEYFVKLDARKLLTKSTLYELGGHRTRAFYQQADENRSGYPRVMILRDESDDDFIFIITFTGRRTCLASRGSTPSSSPWTRRSTRADSSPDTTTSAPDSGTTAPRAGAFSTTAEAR